MALRLNIEAILGVDPFRLTEFLGYLLRVDRRSWEWERAGRGLVSSPRAEIVGFSLGTSRC